MGVAHPLGEPARSFEDLHRAELQEAIAAFAGQEGGWASNFFRLRDRLSVN